ncbi:MAG: hypothetical protein ACYTGR_10620 [Planctomycetota bacterium]
MTDLLAYTPFLEPLNALQSVWYLLIFPLAFGISVIYKAMRLGDLSRFWRQVVVMTVQIVAAMLLLAFGLMVVVELLLPMIPVA